MNIKGRIVTLRAMELGDQELLREMINDPEIEKMVIGHSFPVSNEQQIRWFQSHGNDENNLRLVIETHQDGAIGYANLVNIDWKNRTAFHGIKIARREFRTRGIGTDTVMAVMRYAFEELQLNRLDGAIIDYNEPSKGLYCKRCGWKIEGIRRQAIFKRNRYHDVIVVGILRQEYFELVEQNQYWAKA